MPKRTRTPVILLFSPIIFNEASICASPSLMSLAEIVILVWAAFLSNVHWTFVPEPNSILPLKAKVEETIPAEVTCSKVKPTESLTPFLWTAVKLPRSESVEEPPCLATLNSILPEKSFLSNSAFMVKVVFSTGHHHFAIFGRQVHKKSQNHPRFLIIPWIEGGISVPFCRTRTSIGS